MCRKSVKLCAIVSNDLFKRAPTLAHIDSQVTQSNRPRDGIEFTYFELRCTIHCNKMQIPTKLASTSRQEGLNSR